MPIPFAAKLECLAIIVSLFLLSCIVCVLTFNKHPILLFSLSLYNLLLLYSATSFLENGSPVLLIIKYCLSYYNTKAANAAKI